MKTLEELKEHAAIAKYDLAYNELSRSQRGCIDRKLEYELDAAVNYFRDGAGI